MEGKIRRYFEDVQMGSIQVRLGKRYSFSIADWMDSETPPTEGMAVVFEVGPKRAVNVRPKIDGKGKK